MNLIIIATRYRDPITYHNQPWHASMFSAGQTVQLQRTGELAVALHDLTVNDIIGMPVVKPTCSEK